MEGETTVLTRATSKSESLRTTLPAGIARQFKLKEGDKLEVDFIRQFIAYDWPGNTRELFNKVKRLEVMTMMVNEGDLVELSRSMFKSDVVSEEKSLFDKVEEFERKIIVEALLAANGNKSEVARMLGIHEATVRTKLKRYDISLDNYQMN